MLSKPRSRLPFLVVFCFLASCAQFNIYVTFPASEIREAAEKIEEEVRQGQPAKPSDKPTSQLRRYYFLPTLEFQSALAQAVNLNLSTPGIRKKIESRKARYPELKAYLDKGVIGEGKEGLVVARDLSGLSGRDKVLVKRLIDAENKDREELIREFARANNIDPNAVAKVQAPFADAIREKMDAGHWYQDDAGNWKKK